MAKLLNIGFGNVVNMDKVVAVVSPDAAPNQTSGAGSQGIRKGCGRYSGKEDQGSPGHRRGYAGFVCLTAGDHSEAFWGFFRK